MNSFVYKWKDIGTGKIYIGVHKGTLDDGYVCSSKFQLERNSLTGTAGYTLTLTVAGGTDNLDVHGSMDWEEISR